MIVSIVLARSENGVIGKNNQLPWHLPGDLKFFKRTTSGHTVIMGRKTFESIGKALPKRRNLVISRNKELELPGAEVFHSIEDTLKACIGEDEVFVIGGGSIYEKALSLDMVDKAYITVVHGDFEGDTHFHLPEEKSWNVLSEERNEADEKNAWPYTFMIMERVKG